MDVSYALALGGLVGAALKAILTTSQPTISRQSLGDIITGGAVGLLWTTFGLPMPETATTVQQAAWVGLAAWASADALSNIVKRVGAGIAAAAGNGKK